MFISSSTTGTNFPTAVAIPNLRTDQSPAIAVFKNQLFIAYHPAGAGPEVAVTSTTDGASFTTPAIVNVPDTLGVSLTVGFGGSNLYMAYTSTNNGVYVTASNDGVNWNASSTYVGISSSVAPAIADAYIMNAGYYQEILLVAANGPGNQLTTVESTDGLNYLAPTSYPGILMQGAPAAVGYTNNQGQQAFVVVFQSDDKYHLLFQTSESTTGGFYSPAVGYSNILVGTPPALAYGHLSGSSYTTWVGFKSNDNYNVLFTSGSN